MQGEEGDGEVHWIAKVFFHPAVCGLTSGGLRFRRKRAVFAHTTEPMMLTSFFKPKAAAAAAPTPTTGKTPKANEFFKPKVVAEELGSPSVFSPPANPARARTADEAVEQVGEKRKAADEKPKAKPRGPGAAISAGRVPSGVISVGRAAGTAKQKVQLPSQAQPASEPEKPKPSAFAALQEKILQSLLAQKAAAVRAEDYDLAADLKGKVEQQRKIVEQLAAGTEEVAAAGKEAGKEAKDAEVVKATDTGLRLELDEVCRTPHARHAAVSTLTHCFRATLSVLSCAVAPPGAQEEVQIMYGGTPNGMQIQPDRIAFTEQCAKAIIKRQALEKAQAKLRTAQGSAAEQAEAKAMDVESRASSSPKAGEPAAEANAAAPGTDGNADGGDANTAVPQAGTDQSSPSSAASSDSASASSAAASTGLSFAARAAAKAAAAPVQQRPQPAAAAARKESKEEARDRMYQEAFERMRKMKEQQELLRKQQEEEVCTLRGLVWGCLGARD
eukprot:COSAG03_NODE_1665_length_3698_cov_79.784567_2_plen_501_part_00